MSAKHLFADQIYVISNFVVARNALFKNKRYCRRFLQKIDRYLSPICEIYHYRINVDQFHIILRLGDRKTIENYYRNKHSDPNLESSEIPHESYIFSQAMANLQASTAIHFNRKNGRKGAIFARRFQRRLVQSQKELKSWMRKFRDLSIESIQSSRWRCRERGSKFGSGFLERLDVLRSGYRFYKSEKGDHPLLKSFVRCVIIKFQGQFEKPMFLKLSELNSLKSPP